jgi:DNA-binding transcriptional ArsR family regulator
VLAQHRVQVLDRTQVVAQLGRADLDDQRGRVERLVASCCATAIARCANSRTRSRSAAPAVSRHLKLLKDAGLVVDRAEGTRRLYRLHDEGIDAVRAHLEHVWGDAAARFKLLADN